MGVILAGAGGGGGSSKLHLMYVSDNLINVFVNGNDV